ncbi:MAG: hypothetical protein HQL69_17430 [Magnetococcales bacterium]|nr:hypothetical protein [Magnetococcales bacterium]
MSSIRTQILTVVIFSFMFAGGIGGLSLFEMRHIRDDIHEIANTDLPLVELFTEMEILQLNQGIIVERLYRQIEQKQAYRLEEIENRLANISTRLDRALTTIKNIVQQTIGLSSTTFSGPVITDLNMRIREYEEEQNTFRKLIHKLFVLIKTKQANNVNVLFSELEIRETKLVEIQDQMLSYIKRLSRDAIQRAELREHQSILIMLVIMIAGFFASLLLSFHIAKEVIKPLSQASDIADQIAENHLDITVPTVQMLETKKMFAALEHMIISMQEQRRLEHMLMVSEKMSSIGKLATGIAHEINNPLATATLGLQTLKALQTDNNCHDTDRLLSSIEKGLDRAATIARELLAFSREDNNNFMPTNLQDVLESSLTFVEHKFGGILVQQKWETLLPEVCGDPIKLEQAFVNVLSNSIDAIISGDGEIKISGFSDEADVVVTVEDSGCGIPEAVMPKIFDPFFTTKDIGQGTGLGLSTCYNIIIKHGGSIEMTSKENHGTSVTVRIPVNKQEC